MIKHIVRSTHNSSGLSDVHIYCKEKLLISETWLDIRNCHAQKTGKSVETFVRGLNELAEHCEFGAQRDEHVSDRLVIGIAHSGVSQRLQMESKLTLESDVC